MPSQKTPQREHYEYVAQTTSDIRKLVIAGWIDVNSPKFEQFLHFLEEWERDLANE